MKLTFIGAAITVTGSKQLLEIGDKTILVGCGLYQGIKNYPTRNWQSPPPLIYQAVILTHPHIDH